MKFRRIAGKKNRWEFKSKIDRSLIISYVVTAGRTAAIVFIYASVVFSRLQCNFVCYYF